MRGGQGGGFDTGGGPVGCLHVHDWLPDTPTPLYDPSNVAMVTEYYLPVIS